ncbi:MAG: PAS domain S-box protein [Gemmataceae bacterium]
MMSSGGNGERARSRSGPTIVGIGASAGGLEALQLFLRAMPPVQGLAFVVVVHQDPGVRTLLADVLAKASNLPVTQATEGMRVEANHVYTAPPAQVIEISDGVLHLRPAQQPAERHNPIDRFFQSLAHDQRSKAAAVILSGSGSDGSLGLKTITDFGGTTMVQDPATARHDGMPRSALDTAMPDHVLAPEQLAQELLAYAEHVNNQGDDGEDALRRAVIAELSNISEILLQATGHNFKHYKTSTLARRTMRRIQVLRVGSAHAYVERLRVDPAEAEQLFRDLLIGVTAFFRDPDAFDALNTEVLPHLFENRKTDDPIRIWVPGCATGEEAYSLGMLLREQMDRFAAPPEVQVFATDIDEQALTTARHGVYPAGIAEEMAPERLKRFFVKKAQQYHISKELRELVLFSMHNLINDPPFSKLDVISCRNLLIYLGSHLQKKLIPLFHYALKTGGYLFLGPSESLETHRELFRAVDPKHRISQRLPTAIRPADLLTGRSGPPTTVKPPNVATTGETDTYLVMQRIILDEFAPKAVVVDEEGQILCSSGNLEKYLTVTSGTFQNSITRLAREGLRVGIRAAIQEAAKLRRKVEHDGLSLRGPSGIQRIMVTVQPMPQLGEDTGLFLVAFQDVGPPIQKEEAVRPQASEEAAALIEQLERELETTREDLHRTVQDLEAANEELKSSNEELLSMNEELQSANEELETSKEEVQSANDSLARANSDLENLLSSTRIATLFLDKEGHLRRVTSGAGVIYNVRPSDIGRPLSDFTHMARQMPAMPPFSAVAASDRPFEDEIAMTDGSWFLRRVLPYRNSDGESGGIVVTFIDVTDRKRAADAMRESEERLRVALKAGHMGAWILDLRQQSLDSSLDCRAHFGRNATQSFTYDDWLAAIHPDDRPRWLAEVNRGASAESDFEIEFRATGADGILRWLLVRGSAVRRSDQGTALLAGVSADITDRRQAEEAARWLAAIVESSEDAIVSKDLHSIVTSWNRGAERLFGYTSEEMVGQSITLLIPPHLQHEENVILGKIRRGERTEHFQTIRVSKSGRLIPVSLSVSPIHGANGEVIGASKIARDISEQKEIEAALRESESRFRSMADAAPVLIWECDTNKRCTYFNRGWLEFTGRTMAQECGGGSTEGIHPDDRAACLAIYNESFDRRETFRMEFRLRHRNGEYRWILDSGVPRFLPTGEFAGFIGCCIDITDRQQAEEALREADQKKDNFIATLAHELRNPLAPIRNAVTVLHARPSPDEQMRWCSEVIDRQIGQMAHLLEDLLDVSRITRGKLSLRKSRVALATAIEQAVEVARPLIEAGRHELTLTLPPEAIDLDADLTRLAQVFSNLLTNAAKYTDAGGKILLAAHREGAEVVVSVRDSGIGIGPEHLPRIFEMFSQVASALDRSQGGLGIGLSLVRGIVEMHGGTISAHSGGAGQGSEFIVRLPILVGHRLKTEIEPPTVPRPSIGRMHKKVLVVDDNRDIADSLAMLLNVMGNEVRTAYDGEEAVLAAEQFLPDLILLDIGMPKVNGFDACRRIREQPWSKSMVIIAQTGWGQDEDKRRSEGAGFDYHLTKPVNPTALLHLLSEIQAQR